MSYPAKAIRTTIIELMEGVIGTTRIVPPDTFKFGAFVGQPDAARIAKTVQKIRGQHWFNVRLGPLRQHESSTVSANADRHLGRVEVTIDIWTHMLTTIQETDRRNDLAAMESDAHTAIRALHQPGNLRETALAVPTGIVSGMMLSLDGLGFPTWNEPVEDWEASQSILHSISGSLALTIG